MNQQQYPIGTPGVPWGESEKQQWYDAQRVQRSYIDEVLNPLDAIMQAQSSLIKSVDYGAIGTPSQTYTLRGAVSRHWQPQFPTAVITGGVHGYETSGVQGALLFLETALAEYADQFNFIVAPCVSPWGYETINRWNPETIDPNRAFKPGSDSAEAAQLMQFVEGALSAHNALVTLHVDLHETTDTDNTEFRPALQARDAVEQSVWDIPDGFYCVGDSERPQAAFQTAIIESVAKVTHIAEADEQGRLIGAPIEQRGVINYPKQSLYLCGGMTDAPFVGTTEVYPDSERVDADNCNQAQVAALRGALDFVREHLELA